ncbi:uncharacterized protein TEOVI_000588700 [Trypanosoma equiperdum]|uniref:Uncharacterized protein n=2 Tax=Trypanozoon TaxID=39700 RepID=Q4GYJ1_TRYB2|nr:hypothetical protein, conserved [Trypanosoma brucei brucei TREU927]CAJ16593.1 hypothetical protein, conserved [Trypanosoma brucei brucei TREU927]SCU64451.1 hypothetical protein, conserved [Trypanosoma equiperdum]
MASNQQDANIGVVDRQTEPKRRRRSSGTAFSSMELHRRFEEHVAKAQQLFLQGNKDGAEQEATLALRIHPTDHLFALLAVIAESKGQFNRASDLRLLQAFMANDAVLWEELLHEFMQERLYYKSAVCLHRLAVLETRDKVRYRTLQLQLADLYIGLGEFKRAAHILISLWNGSRCRDFEVFAMLSSLFFQLGRWNSLHRLIESSLKSTFRPVVCTMEGGEKPPDAPSSRLGREPSTVEGKEELTAPMARRRVPRRVRFFGVDDNDECDNDTDSVVKRAEGIQQAGSLSQPTPTVDNTCLAEALCEGDDFDFTSEGCDSQSVHGIRSGACATPSAVIHSMYGDSVKFRTATDKKNFLTLVNVHAELLNEEGNFPDTVRLVEFAAGCLNVSLLELHPDLLVRLGVAYAFLGGMEQQCREVFHHLVDTCPMAEYGDVLYDAANALQQVGLHTEARMLFQTVRRYHEFRMKGSNGNADDGNNLDDEEKTEVKTVFVAALFAESQCEASLGNIEVACDNLCRVLEVDPHHLQSRLALGRLCMYDMNDTERAIEVLTPRESEPPLERIQLAAELVRVFARSKKYVEAIALGVSVFELIMSSQYEGDADSVAPGSTRRSTAPLSMPTLSPASSAIIPPSAISDIVNGPRLSSSADLSSTRLSHALATSIRASSVAFRINLARRGGTPLTASVYGASAAASTVAGWSHGDEETGQKDSSTIFRFNRTLKPVGCLRPVNKGTCNRKCPRAADEGDVDTEDDCRRARKRRREEEVAQRDVRSFWKEHADSDTDNCGEPSNQENETEHQMEQGGAHLSTDKKSENEDEGPCIDDGSDDGDATRFELPSLEEVSKQFGDSYMQELFMQASSNEAMTSAGHMPASNVGGTIALDNVLGDDTEAGLGQAAAPLRVTMRDALKVLGCAGFIELAVTVVDCYGAIGKFTEAKEFAFVVLIGCQRTSIFRHLVTMERPLRWAVLRAALASGECEDAYRVGIRLLQEQCSEQEKDRILELLFGVLNRTEMGSSILLRLVAGGYQENPSVLVLLGNRYFLRRTYIRALNMYLAAMQRRPNDVLVCFLVGVCFLLVSHQKRIRARNACVVSAWHYLLRYQGALRDIGPQRQAEATYNCARALQYLGLHHLSTPLYEQVAYEYSVPEQCSLPLQRAARFNLYFTYRWRTGNSRLALDALQPRF